MGMLKTTTLLFYILKTSITTDKLQASSSFVNFCELFEVE
jgi:hypothetical protein